MTPVDIRVKYIFLNDFSKWIWKHMQYIQWCVRPSEPEAEIQNMDK